jgi:hypothetical protein
VLSRLTSVPAPYYVGTNFGKLMRRGDFLKITIVVPIIL